MTTGSTPERTAMRLMNRDRGMSFVELLVAIVLLGISVVAVLTAVRATVIGSTTERDHAKAQQWLQSAIGVIEAQDFASCNPADINGAAVEAVYQAAVDDPLDGAKRPYGFDAATIDVQIPEVWDGDSFVDFDSQSVCYDGIRLRQQRIAIDVVDPNGPDQSALPCSQRVTCVEMIKVDR